jgi:hypothetical protein
LLRAGRRARRNQGRAFGKTGLYARGMKYFKIQIAQF